MPNCLSTLSHNCFGADVPDDTPVSLFKCYNLPSVVQDHVVKFMDKFDITQCSIISPNFRVVAARAKTKLYLIRMDERIKFDTSDAQDEIRRLFDKPAPRIKISAGRNDVFIRFFWVEQKVQIDLLLDGKPRVRLNEDLKMAIVGNTIVIYNSNPSYSKLADYQFILDIIFGTFTVSVLRLGQDEEYIMPKEILFPLAQRYKNLVKEFCLEESSKRHPPANLTSEELSALLDNMEVQDLEMSWRAEPGAKYTGILKTKRMLLPKASWLTLDDLFSMECERLVAFATLFTTQDLISIVHKWQEGGFEKLEGLTLTKYHGDEDWTDVLDDIEGTVLPTRGHGDHIKKEVVRSDGKKFVMVVSHRSFTLGKPSKYD